ncbi:acid phosphatase-domain-containing protein [Crepidotus variabilis]|uniref:Acid phosphatase-domain-containing protein n=1 Tax=Crepidotus variabilis TaxID=179855 RepID=A0A9P6JLG3_9AGAR|nr:acid phosphatase-domain-containing protein [Crepidotus variabilis]
MSFPKVIGLDTDWTIWQGYLGQWGRGRGGNAIAEDNIVRVDRQLLRDSTNRNNWIRVYNDIYNIVQDLLRNGAKLAIVSRNPNKNMCDRALYYFNAPNPGDHNNEYSLSHLVTYNEIVDQSKVEHWRRIHGWTQEDYSEFLMFDDEAAHNSVRIELGVTFQQARNKQGLLWQVYQDGLNAWRRGKGVMIYPTPGFTPRRVHIGYSGLPSYWIYLVTHGEGTVEYKVPYRWGYALYVADHIEIAKYFCGWNGTWNVGGAGDKNYVCEIWVKDYDLFCKINKIWVPENIGKLPQANNTNWSFEATGQNQEDRDRTVSQWGVHTPYVLFSQHHGMNGLPNPRQRFTEMVVCTQIQRGIFDLVVLSDDQVKQASTNNPNPFPFRHQLNSWNITVPNETWNEFRSRGERDFF